MSAASFPRQPARANSAAAVFLQGGARRVRLRVFLGSDRAGPFPTRLRSSSLRLCRALPPPPTNTTRNPLLSFRLRGSSLLRFAERRFTRSLLFHEPPRTTRAVLPPSSFHRCLLQFIALWLQPPDEIPQKKFCLRQNGKKAKGKRPEA